MKQIKFGYVVTGDHEDSMTIIENLRNFPGVEEVKTQIVIDKIKEDSSVIILE